MTSFPRTLQTTRCAVDLTPNINVEKTKSDFNDSASRALINFPRNGEFKAENCLRVIFENWEAARLKMISV